MELFYEKIDKHIENLSEKFRCKFVITKVVYNDIVLVLKDGSGEAQFKFWVFKHFKLVTIGELQVVYGKKSNNPVITYEQLYATIKECHERVGHHGRDKTWNEVKQQYCWIPFDVVVIFLSLCDVCSNRKGFPKPITDKPIVSIGYLTRLQIDLIDMRSVPDGEFKWILHAKDHFTKYSWTYPLKTKEAQPVAETLLQQFYAFGPPRILQSDNGKEFVARVIKDLKNIWSDLVIINGRPRHPQTQGLVERGNQTLEAALGKWMQSKGSSEWSKGLAPVAYAINTSEAQTIGETPYEVVFGQKPRSDFEMWKLLSENGIEDEEKLPREIMEALNENVCSELVTVNPTQAVAEVPAGVSISTANDITSLTNATISPNSIAGVEASESISPSNFESNKEKDTEENEVAKCCAEMDHEEVVCFSTLAATNSIDNNSAEDDSSVISRHKQIRDEAEECYMQSIAKRQKKYDETIKLRQYQLGDVVGLKIDKVDRTNTTPKILPCKVISIQSSNDNTNIYHLCTTKCILSTKYTAPGLIDLTKCNFSELRAIDSQILPLQTFIQACKDYVSTGSNPVVEACTCNGNCATKKCPCKAAKVQCASKCHPAKKQPCSNI
ncbi:unnamed protein product [Rotaria magnacalcarata]|uniref:Integrase catalytic domain-containing protein n=1 Tax=Rotaria magnacalcarata TaxID=392030 RepID=A0A816XGI4_9BILA|nr:unnamed protein product [Rotaria magnacalcarata]